LFYGQHQRSIDKNNRVEVPANLRAALDGRVVITQGFDRNLLALPEAVFNELTRLLTALNMADPLARGLMRMLLGNATYCDIDEAGSVVIPPKLEQLAGLESETVWVGQGKYLEIWSQLLWDEQELALQDAEANSQRFISMNLSGL
jgi:MraZ protein